MGSRLCGNCCICLSKKCGHEPIGIDISPEKVESIRQSKSPIKEPHVANLLENGDSNVAIIINEASQLDADMSMICVGTPLH